MRNEKIESIDRLISEEMHQSADALNPSDSLKGRIWDSLEADRVRPVRRGVYRMNRIPKMVAVVAACTMLAGVGVYAGGAITGVFSSSKGGYDYRSYQDLSKAEQRIGAGVKAPETLSGGFKFVGITMNSIADTTDDGQETNKRTGLIVTYQNSKGEELTLSVDPKGTLTKSQYQATKKTDDATFYYVKQESLYLPDGTKPTAEETKREKSDPYYTINYGGKQKETISESSVDFAYGGMLYDLSGENVSLSSDAMFQAAESVLR